LKKTIVSLRKRRGKSENETIKSSFFKNCRFLNDRYKKRSFKKTIVFQNDRFYKVRRFVNDR